MTALSAGAERALNRCGGVAAATFAPRHGTVCTRGLSTMRPRD